MKLYFLRHATASDFATSDEARKLTREGEEEARIAGRAMDELKVRPSHVFTSPLIRARQTAEIACKELKFNGKIETTDALKNGVSTSKLMKIVHACGSESDVLLVGHMPSLSVHIAMLIGAKDPEAVPLGKGSIACVELERVHQDNGQLRWMVRQKQMSLMVQ